MKIYIAVSTILEREPPNPNIDAMHQFTDATNPLDMAGYKPVYQDTPGYRIEDLAPYTIEPMVPTVITIEEDEDEKKDTDEDKDKEEGLEEKL